MIDISDIRMINVITELGSMNRAAEALHVSQPTLSKRLSRMEQKINMELFYRHATGMVPTEAARFLLREAEGLNTRLRVIERQLELMANRVGGQINIGVGPIVEQLILPKVLLDFAERNTEFKIAVVTESPDALLEQLKRSEIDIAIGPFEATEIGDDFKSVLEMSEKLVVAVRAGHELTHRADTSNSLNHILQYRFVSPNIPKHMASRLLKLIQLPQIEPDIICDNYSLAKNIVMNSDFITAGPASLFRSEFSRGELVELNVPFDMHWHCTLFAKPETLLAPAVKVLVKIFAQYMNPISKEA